MKTDETTIAALAGKSRAATIQRPARECARMILAAKRKVPWRGGFQASLDIAGALLPKAAQFMPLWERVSG